MFKVSNRNTRKRCLLISKITLKTSERRHLTTSYLPEVTAQNHVLDSFSQNIYQFAIKSYGPYFQQQQTHICYFMRNKKSLPKYLSHEKFKMSVLFISEKTAPKLDKIFNLLSYIQRVAISVSQSQTSYFSVIYCILKLILKFELKKDIFFIKLLTKVS